MLPRARGLLPAVLLAASACAAARPRSPAPGEIIARWIGRPERALLAELGTPKTSITDLSGETYDEYRGDGCTTTFVVDAKGVIVNVAWKGDSCALTPAGK